MRPPTREHCGNVPHRTSPDSAWPLRGPDGLTYAERKATARDARARVGVR